MEQQLGPLCSAEPGSRRKVQTRRPAFYFQGKKIAEQQYSESEVISGI